MGGQKRQDDGGHLGWHFFRQVMAGVEDVSGCLLPAQVSQFELEPQDLERRPG